MFVYMNKIEWLQKKQLKVDNIVYDTIPSYNDSELLSVIRSTEIIVCFNNNNMIVEWVQSCLYLGNDNINTLAV